MRHESEKQFPVVRGTLCARSVRKRWRGKLLSCCFALWATAVSAAEPMPALQQPLAFGLDSIEVTSSGTLRRRYRHAGDWDRMLASCLAEARENAAARKTPPRRVTMGCVFLKDARMTSTDLKGGDGQPLTATYTTDEKFIEAMRTRGMKDYSDFMFAFSGGELEVNWLTATVEGLHWSGPGDAWSCQPRAVGDQVLKTLEPHKDAGVCMWMFCAGRPVTLNPDPKNPKRRFSAPPYGISYTQWPLHGGYSLVLCAPDTGLMVHEFNHRYLDNLEQLEGLRLTMFHGLAQLGYDGRDCGFPTLLNTYSSVYRYIIRRDMWRRFTITTPNQNPREPFTGRAYAWSDVQYDCWFKLPELHEAELSRLTGLPTLKMNAEKKNSWRLYTVGDADRARLRSAYVDAGSDSDTQLNNLLSLRTESCAVLATATGHWLFVRPDLADVYVHMAQLRGRPGDPLSVHGYVLEGVRPLLVLQAPASLQPPASELGYFR